MGVRAGVDDRDVYEGRDGGDGRAQRETAVFPLTPAQSKRLIAKGVACLPEVREAMRSGLVVVTNGTTNAYVVEELAGRRLDFDRIRYAVGIVTGERLGEVPPGLRTRPTVFDRGEEVPFGTREGKLVDLRTGTVVDNVLTYFVSRFKRGDVLIKGANAVDAAGRVGILLSNPTGGTVGATLGAVYGRGCHLVVPVGLEKLVPNVEQAASACGQLRWTYCLGSAVGMMPLCGATVVTELQALKVLVGVEAVHVASGGVLGGEGCVVIGVAGTPEQVDRCMRLVKELKNELPVSSTVEPVTSGQRLPDWW